MTATLVERARSLLQDLDEAPAHVAEPVRRALVDHLRATSPESVVPLSAWSPTEPVPNNPPAAPAQPAPPPAQIEAAGVSR